jgi:hypothetical protein
VAVTDCALPEACKLVVVQVAVPVPVAELKVTSCVVQPEIAVPPTENETCPPIEVTLAVETALAVTWGETVAVKVTEPSTEVDSDVGEMEAVVGATATESGKDALTALAL